MENLFDIVFVDIVPDVSHVTAVGRFFVVVVYVCACVPIQFVVVAAFGLFNSATNNSE